jgi:hypothetical protein
MQRQLMRIAGELAALPTIPNHPATPHINAATRSILIVLGVCGALGDPADPSATGPEGAPGEPPASPGHNLDNIVQDKCKSENVPFVVLQSGYGVEGVRLAIERFITVDGGPNAD